MSEFEALFDALPRAGGGFDWRAIEALPALKTHIDAMRKAIEEKTAAKAKAEESAAK